MKPAAKGRILGIDPGRKRIGVAVSDELQLTAQPLETVEARPQEAAIEVLHRLAREYNVSEMVVGLPVNMDGTSGSGAEAARQFAARLGEAVPCRVHLLDERLTSRQAEKILIEANLRRSRRRDVRDRLAAVLILQSYLDRKSDGD